MGFTQSCCIRKKTDRLIQELINMGLKNGGKGSDDPCGGIYCAFGVFYEVGLTIPSRPINVVDCGENEDLFLAVAGMRDDTDIGQYFVMEREGLCIPRWGIYTPIGSFVQSHKENFIERMNNTSYPWPHHRATLGEIIDYFTDREEYFKKVEANNPKTECKSSLCSI